MEHPYGVAKCKDWYKKLPMGCNQSRLLALRQEQSDLKHSIASLKVSLKTDQEKLAALKQECLRERQHLIDAQAKTDAERASANQWREKADALKYETRQIVNQETEKAKKQARDEEIRCRKMKDECTVLSCQVEKLNKEKVELERQADLIEARVEESLAKLPEGDGAQSYDTILRVSLGSRFKMDVDADVLCESSAYFNAALHSELKLDRDADGCIYLKGNPYIWKSVFSVISGGLPDVSKDSLLSWMTYLHAHPHYKELFRQRFYTCLEEGKKRHISHVLKPFDTGPPHRWREVEDSLNDLKMFALSYGALSEYYILSPSILESILRTVFVFDHSWNLLIVCDAEEPSIRVEIRCSDDFLLPPSLGPYGVNIRDMSGPCYKCRALTYCHCYGEQKRKNEKRGYLGLFHLEDVLDDIYRGKMSLIQ